MTHYRTSEVRLLSSFPPSFFLYRTMMNNLRVLQFGWLLNCDLRSTITHYTNILSGAMLFLILSGLLRLPSNANPVSSKNLYLRMLHGISVISIANDWEFLQDRIQFLHVVSTERNLFCIFQDTLDLGCAWNWNNLWVSIFL
jgi:hypothetical protein